MKLSQFIKDLHYNSTQLFIIDQKPEEDVDVFCGTKGVLVHNVKYLNTYQDYKVVMIEPVEDWMPGLVYEVTIKEEEEPTNQDFKKNKNVDPMEELFYR